ncbi:nudix hydrolase 18, mitochondrial-like [Gastrolobium bilobum]|uniref:nudix hydrolase 18, mitochondrial-like n=1 Tax=Gastrolobium bilobum TaxID=150636 RepID=UPI002AB24F14|nr:nudix hydrolase 18, mitochondrial-like [Gastrolobium bilobum]
MNKKIVMGLFFSRNLPFKYFLPFLFSKNLYGHLFPKQLECLVARTGRHLQRYDDGCRQVVGCIPYRYRRKGLQKKELEVLVISAQNGNGMQFPKGGWETDESMEQAALRETIEEAGVAGNIQSKLGKWFYKSKRQGRVHEGYMFSLLVNKQLENWPEKNFRKRRWMTVAEAKKVCPHTWMKEALDVLVNRQSQSWPETREI